MINKTIAEIKKYVSGERAYNYARGIAEFHRIQASRGYRDAAKFCLNLFEKEKIKSHIYSFEADESISCWTQKFFKEWNCSDARLELVSPSHMVLSDYCANPLSIVQRSVGVCFNDVPVDVVRMERGKLIGCEEGDVAGKIVFISEDPNKYLDWAAKWEVYGFISDYMSDVFVRERNDRYDDRLYLSFKWMNEERDKKTFSFLLSPRLGDQLRKICFSMEEEYQNDNAKQRYAQVKGYIDAEFENGSMEDVVALIPGESEEEVLIIAHLCHAKGCANDNASGCGGAIEVMKTINDLINCGKLLKPKRSIRALLVPEIVGTYAYLKEHEEVIPKIKAGINLDMIGRRQEGSSGLVGIMGVPDSTASFVLDLAAYAEEELGRDVSTFNIEEYVTPIYTKILPYVGGSDHYVLSEPSIGIPTIIIMQWLDSNYHSTADSIDKLDPNVFSRTCGIAASYIYSLANMSVEDIPFIANKTRERYTRQILNIVKEYNTGKLDQQKLREKLEYTQSVYSHATKDYRRFFEANKSEQLDKLILREIDFFGKFADNIIAEYSNEDYYSSNEVNETVDRRYQKIPYKKFRGPITFAGFESTLSEKQFNCYKELKSKYPQFYGMNSMNDFILHRVDGKRNLLEISKGAAMEGKLYNPEYVCDFMNFLHESGLIDFI